MTEAELQAHNEASEELLDERLARGEIVFDGDPHWVAAMKGIAENAIAAAERLKALRQARNQ